MITKCLEEENKRLEQDNTNLLKHIKCLTSIIELQEIRIKEYERYKCWYFNHRSEMDKGC